MQKILLAYNGGDADRRALDTAAQLADALDATVSVVSVVPFTATRAGGVIPWDKEHHADELHEAEALLRERGIAPEVLLPVGDVEKVIERVTEAGQFDVVVVGHRHLGRLHRLIDRSVAGHVATHANATVVVVNQGATAD